MQLDEKLNCTAFYHANQLDLIPLKAWDAMREGRNIAKIPLYNNWRDANHDAASIEKHIKNGNNIALRIPRGLMVVDVDKRNGGLESLAILQQIIGVNLSDIAPTVMTPTGGFHFYLQVPPDHKYRKAIRHNSAYLDGLEFKTFRAILHNSRITARNRRILYISP